MIGNHSSIRRLCAFAFLFIAATLFPCGGDAQTSEAVSVPVLHLPEPFLPLQHYGPYNAHILVGGRGLTKSLPKKDPILESTSSWTLSAWVEFAPGVSFFHTDCRSRRSVRRRLPLLCAGGWQACSSHRASGKLWYRMLHLVRKAGTFLSLRSMEPPLVSM